MLGGIFLWAVRQEGRINEHERRHEEQEKRVEALRQEFSKRHEEVREDLTYIRNRIDTALSGGVKR